MHLLALCTFVMLASCSDKNNGDGDILQLGETKLYFTLASSSQDVTVTAPAEWTCKVSSGSDWCSCAAASSELKVSVKANDTGKKRVATIVVTCGSQTVELKVEQESVDPKLEVSVSALKWKAEGGKQEVEVTANVEWEAEVVTSMVDWISCEKKEGTDNILVILVKSNTTTRKRVARIRVSAAGLKEDIDISQDFSSPSVVYPHVSTSFDFGLLEDPYGTTLPDFSHVGYMGSECDIPDVPIKKTLSSPGADIDATAMIQQAIDEVSAMPLTGNVRGAVLLKSGTYKIQKSLDIKASGVVLRGEGEGDGGTKLIAAGVKNGESEHHRLIKIAGSGNLSPSAPPSINIKDEYVPVGQFWVAVNNASEFHVGDHVTVYRPGTDNWIHDLKMDQIYASNSSSGYNWDAASYNLDYERIVTKVIGDTLHFDNPVLMAMETKYGGGAVFKSSITGRLTHCGVENMQIVSEYDAKKKDASGYCNDENHSWTAIDITKAEHSWIRNVTSRYFAYGLAEIRSKSLYVTVRNCKCLDGVAKREGGRLYSFLIADASACLVRDCETTHGRHDCVTGSKGVGPNVFTHVKIRNSHADAGPHQRWNVGTLYDCIDSDGDILVQDRGNWGTGHGWAGANQYLWNCKAARICVQSPWVSAKNYSVGSQGTKNKGTHNNTNRPDGEWIEPGKAVSPASLFEAQLDLRIKGGRLYHQGK